MHARRLSCAAFAVLALSAQPAFAGQGSQGRHAKIDRALEDSLAAGEKSQRVIITVKPGFRDGIREALRKHGDVIKSEHPSIEAIAAVVHSSDIGELVDHDGVAYVSIDATVNAGASWRSSRYANQNVVSVSQSGSTSVSGPASTLRETLGLSAKASSALPSGAG